MAAGAPGSVSTAGPSWTSRSGAMATCACWQMPQLTAWSGVSPSRIWASSARFRACRRWARPRIMPADDCLLRVPSRLRLSTFVRRSGSVEVKTVNCRAGPCVVRGLAAFTRGAGEGVAGLGVALAAGALRVALGADLEASDEGTDVFVLAAPDSMALALFFAMVNP